MGIGGYIAAKQSQCLSSDGNLKSKCFTVLLSYYNPHTNHCVLGSAQNKEITVLKYICLIKSSLAEQPQNLPCSVNFDLYSTGPHNGF